MSTTGQDTETMECSSLSGASISHPSPGLRDHHGRGGRKILRAGGRGGMQ